MSHEIFRQGGPHNIRRTGRDQYTMSVEMPTDAMGMTARECTDATCSPGAFKIKYGTGLTGEQEHAYCPYCRWATDPDEFITEEQKRYLQDIVTDEASQGLDRMVKGAFGLGPSNRKKIGGDFISMEMKYEPGHRHPHGKKQACHYRINLDEPYHYKHGFRGN